jgi:hypothetical protein
MPQVFVRSWLRKRILTLSCARGARILEKISRSVTIGELNEAVAEAADTPVNANRRRRPVPAIRVFSLIPSGLRRLLGVRGLSGSREIVRGCGRDPQGYVRTPNVSPQNSQTLRLTDPIRLTTLSRSGPGRRLYTGSEGVTSTRVCSGVCRLAGPAGCGRARGNHTAGDGDPYGLSPRRSDGTHAPTRSRPIPLRQRGQVATFLFHPTALGLPAPPPAASVSAEGTPI